MASVRSLKTVWQVRYYDSARSPSETTDSLPKDEYTERQAEKEAEYRQQLYDRGKYDPWTQGGPGKAVDKGVTTVGQAIDAYIQDKVTAGRRGERRGWSEQTAKRYRSTLKHFARHAGISGLLRNLSSADIRAFVYRDDLSDASKRTYYGMLRTWTRWLRDRDLPAPEMPPELQTRKTLPDWCSREQLKTIIRAFRQICQEDAANNSNPDINFTAQKDGPTRWWMQWAWRFAFWQGLRRGEIVAIRCGGVDLEARQMVVGDETFVPKGKREDVIPLSEPAANIAREWGAHERPPKERLFKHSQADKISRAFTEARKRAIRDDLLDETASGPPLPSPRACD